jgi:hypothetical protein
VQCKLDLVPLSQRSDHLIERIRKLSKKVHVLTEVPNSHLLCLPRQVSQVGVKLFERGDQQIPGWRINFQKPLGQRSKKIVCLCELLYQKISRLTKLLKFAVLYLCALDKWICGFTRKQAQQGQSNGA